MAPDSTFNDDTSGPLIDVRIDGLAPGGDAVGRQEGGEHDGRATFVALAAPGERVRARVVRDKARVAWAELVSVAAPAPARVPPPCPYFGRCGGCQWQHVDLPAQRAAKRAIVERALGVPIARLETPVEGGVPYRDRARLVVGPRGEVGFRARREHTVVDVGQCLLLVPATAHALTAVRALAGGWPAGTEIDLQAGNDGVHVSVTGTFPAWGGTAATLPPAAEALARWRASGVSGVRVRAASRGGVDSAAGAIDVDVSEPGGPPLRIPAGGFAQVGRAANAALVRAVNAAIGATPGKVLELYAGSGNFTRHLVAASESVLACEGDRAAVERGRRNVPGATWAARPPRVVDADTILADPPRAGLDTDNLRAAGLARRRLVYVSCDPQTLARDALALARQGLVLREARALDLMAHTFHVEVVATFDRRRSRWEPSTGSQTLPR